MVLFSRRQNLSPLLLAFIFITFFNGVLTRHRIRHHRDRFKRQQGAHLYLPGSYVTEGGEGEDAGPWTEWSEPSPCSRSCGGGVSTQYRQCTIGYGCQGPTMRHFSCNTQDCPDNADFRAQQCSEYDEIPFEGVKYTWVPYVKAPNPCELNCMPKGERFYFRHKTAVTDGTRCNDASLDVCVNGICQPVGCDMMLGSHAREDSCRQCGGDGSTCSTVKGVLDMQDLQVGYNDILLIPYGATNIRVEEIAPSNNYLALRNTSGYYHLNGNWRIDFPRTLEFAGSKFHYERSPQGFSAPDKVTCLGPINEKLIVVLLTQDRNVGVEYEYSVPTNIQIGSETETYSWTFDQFTPCSATCGGGVQYRNVTCAGRKTLEPADKSLCDANTEPESVRRCAEVACEAQWIPHPWGNCSAPCGKGGVQTREVSCQQIVSNGYPSLVQEEECAKLPKPPQQQPCNVGKVCATWHIGPWKPCDHLCGDGRQTRKVKCYIKNGSKIEVLPDAECDAIETKPEIEKKCNLRPCEGVDWVSSEWSGCDRCGLTNETRKIHCATASGKIVADDLCEKENKPAAVRQCDTTNVTCEYLWYASQWSECSTNCGEGVQTRTIFCGASTPEGVKKVENGKCDPSKHFETIKNCTGEQKECEGEWFSGPWTKCSKECGGGERSKKVICLLNNEVVDSEKCGSEDIVFTLEECNTQPCSEDTIIPTDVTHSVDESEKMATTEPIERESVKPADEDYEIVPDDECEDGEWVDLDELDDTTRPMDDNFQRTVTALTDETKESSFSMDDLMMNDGTISLGESETILAVSLDTGSGDGELISSSINISRGYSESSDTTLEGSGDSTDVSQVTEISVQDTAATIYNTGLSGGTDITIEGSDLASLAVISTTDVSAQASENPDVTTEISGSNTSENTGETDETGITESSSPAESVTTAQSGSVTESGTTAESVVTTKSGELLGNVSISESVATTENVIGSISTKLSSSDVTESTVSVDKTENTDTTESIARAQSTDTTASTDITESTDTTENTDTTESTDITESPDTTQSIENTGTTETTVETETTLGSISTSISKTDSSDMSTTTGISSSSVPSGTTEEPGPEEAEVKKPATERNVSAVTTESGMTESVTIESSATETGLSGSTEKSTRESSEVSASTESVTELSGTGESISAEVFETTKSVSTEVTLTMELTPTDLSSLSESSITEVSETTDTATDISLITETTGLSESGTVFTGSSEITETTLAVTTGETETTTEFTDSTETSEPTEFDIWSSTTESGQTEESTSTDLWGTTPITDIFETRKPRMCRRKKTKTCKTTQYGCCWDNITPAEGPFDKGCPNPQTCKESKFGCCEDGVSPALGKKFKGCPSATCNETLFGCCPDNKTPADGNDNEGCPPPPPACLKEKYGCCDDNITSATGPQFEGCKKEEEQTKSPGKEEEMVTTETPEPEIDCSNSTYGCCPDGVSVATGEYFEGCDIFKDNCTESYFRCCPDGKTSAKGPNYKGCETPCSNSTYGCCADGITPAHGYSGEGCCLAAPFGCCPDHITPARGANNDGCGCQFSPYGCCPDNKTYARGYNNEGCGCQYTTHGCCPDNYTPSPGPNFEGCLCHTFQFGCCPDGVTTSKGPHQQGCNCRDTEFGCCSDDHTPASGPNMAGCGCDTTKFGCCHDGITEAKGDNFEGCENVPRNLQDSCSLPKERGSCRNYTVKWFYDMDYGGCSRFWYGGCEGNDNRFKAKEDCDSVCVKPEGTDRCKLPKVPGPCEGYFPQWYYDKDRKQCVQFVYGGCLGNNNRFETREECQELCVKDDSVDGCEQPREEGPCRGQYRRYFFDKESQQCSEFIYGGCKGNNNNFPTIDACKQKCAQPGRKKDHCSLPRAQGNCTGREPRWYYDTPEKRCVPFYYSGCNGNNNNFISKEACETDCPKEIVKDTCHLPAETGECANYTERWYYDTREGICRQFYYGGCGGNDNNFISEGECQRRCKSSDQPSTPTPLPQPEVELEPFRTEFCFLPSEPGRCDKAETKYFYDKTDGVCKSFAYTGCEGNRNSFSSAEDCFQFCGTTQDLCTLPPVVGPCNGEYESYYYDQETDSCQTFNFGGCEGNYNRFPDKSSCEQRCRRAPPTPSVTEAPPAIPSDVAMCYEPADTGNCSDSQAAFFFDINSRKCTPFTYTGCGGNSNRFISEEQCERQCGSFRGQDVCNMPRDPGPCRGYFVKYYYDNSIGRCNQFAYGGCSGNGNRFSSVEECESICVTHGETKTNVTSTAICLLPVEKGSCLDYHKRWYFDYDRGECLAYIYSGCGGNLNSFRTFQSCLDHCSAYLPQTEAPAPVQPTEISPHPCQALFDECTTLRCAYGIEAYVDENQCNRCQCTDPCRGMECPDDQKCAIDLNRNRTKAEDPNFLAICREINKEGDCPPLEPSESACEKECNDDADCSMELKCCSTGCGTACVVPIYQQVPAELVTQPYPPAYTEAPVDGRYAPPQVDTQTFKPEAQGLLGDHIVLNCAVTGNPNPTITWKKDDLVIDGSQPRYHIKLDQTLQIITLHKTDSGIYLCTAENKVGPPLTNQIKLDVLDSPPRAASVLEPEERPNMVVSLNAPTTINCFALGYPFPAVTWWKDDKMIPLKNNEFEVRKDYSLLIHSLQLHNLGIYTCQAYNGIGHAASWAVTVRAKGPYHSTDPKDQKYMQYIVNAPDEPTTPPPTRRPQYPYRPAYRPTPQPYIPPPYTEPSPDIIPNEIVPQPVPENPEPEPGNYIVPVRTNITLADQRFPVGGDLSIPCEVDGFPTPQVQWYKDGVPIYPSDRVQISESHRLSIKQANKADSGTYQCEAANSYYKSSSSVAILVEGMYINPKCTDNPYFANCDLIVRAKYCAHKYYAKFCCRSCTEAGLLPVDGPHLESENKQSAIDENEV